MYRGQRLDAIDTRWVFRVYAVLVGFAGILLFVGNPDWFGANTAVAGSGDSALIRVLGSIMMAAACCAAGFAVVDPPSARRRALLWFAAGHAVIWLMVGSQQIAIWAPGIAERAAQVLLGLSFALFYVWSTLEGSYTPKTLISLFGAASPDSDERLRSQYEQQIREVAKQEERNRLARDLHDSIKQQVFVIQTAAATTQARFDADPDGAKEALEQIRASAREAMTEMQVMLDQLRAVPLENAGLIEALRKQCEALGFRTGARVEFKPGNLPPSSTLPPGAHEAILRAAQEAMANVGRHAKAGNVLVSLDAAQEQIELRIQDDGMGFDPEHTPRGQGIANMRARAEEFGGKLCADKQAGRWHVNRILDPVRGWRNATRVSKEGYRVGCFADAIDPYSSMEKVDPDGVALHSRCFLRSLPGGIPPRASAKGDSLMPPVSIALVDDHRVVARSLKAYLESFPDLKVVGIATSGEELLNHLLEWNPQVVLQDLLMPGGIDGIETTRRILQCAPGVKVIALTASTDEARMMGVLRTGAVGYVRKDAEPEVLLAAVRAVARGKTYIDPSVSRQMLQASAAHDDLTPRETEVLRQLALGRPNKEIADALSISDETVKTHVGHVFSKLQVENRSQAIVQALKRGLVSLEELE